MPSGLAKPLPDCTSTFDVGPCKMTQVAMRQRVASWRPIDEKILVSDVAVP